MIIREQHGKVCPENHHHAVGNLVCEECDSWRFIRTGRTNKHGIECADEYCDRLPHSLTSKVKTDG